MTIETFNNSFLILTLALMLAFIARLFICGLPRRAPSFTWLMIFCVLRSWIIPVTPAEALFAKDRGVDCLEERMEAAHFNYLDGERPSVV